jgi:hypothetical protein
LSDIKGAKTGSERFQDNSLGAGVRQAGGRNRNKTCEATPNLSLRVPEQQAKLLHLTALPFRASAASPCNALARKRHDDILKASPGVRKNSNDHFVAPPTASGFIASSPTAESKIFSFRTRPFANYFGVTPNVARNRVL